MKRVVFVGNNWDGTADLLAPRTFKRLARINVIPDYAPGWPRSRPTPTGWPTSWRSATLIGEGHDQYVDDMYSSNDGRLVIVSRPSFADVVGDQPRDRQDRVAVPGRRRCARTTWRCRRTAASVVVSASTGNVVHVLRVARRQAARQVPLRRLAARERLHRRRQADPARQHRHGLQPARRARTSPTRRRASGCCRSSTPRAFKIERRYNLRKALDARGPEDISTAVRPMTLSPDEKKLYFQLSFFHGFVEMDRRTGKIARVMRLPNLIPDTPRERTSSTPRTTASR